MTRVCEYVCVSVCVCVCVCVCVHAKGRLAGEALWLLLLNRPGVARAVLQTPWSLSH